MTIVLDLIGSWLVRGVLIAIMLTLTLNMNNALYHDIPVVNGRALIATVDSVMYADMNAAGYNVSTLSNTFSNATSTSVYFNADLNNNGSAELVKYYTGYDATSRTYTLYRSTLGNTLTLASGIDSIGFSFYDKRDSVTSVLSSIRSIGVTIIDSVSDPSSGSKTAILSSFRVYPPNLYL